jgi:hypothetical protein
MHKRMIVVSLMVALLTPAAARAGVTLGARLGWAIPGGDITEGIKLSDQIDGQVPLWLDLGWSFDQRLALGVYFRYAANVRDSDAIGSCDFWDADCGGYGLGAGAQLTWRLSPNAGPWIGAFGGFEALSFEARLRPGDNLADQAFRGWEVGGQGGIDFALGPVLLGPYVAVGVGRFTVVDLDLGDIGGPVADIRDEANHTWINLGLRLAFNL